MRCRSCRAVIRAALATLGLVLGPAEAPGADRGIDGRSPFICREWQVDDGLVGSHIEALCRSVDGYVWLGSYGEGPVRFDGVAFTRLRSISPAYAGHLRRDDPTTVLVGSASGGLWIGSRSGGLIRWDGEGKVTAYTTRDGLPHDGVLSARETRDGSLWVGTQEGLCRVRGGAIERDPGPGGPGRVRISSVWEDPDGTLWVATKGQGLFRRSEGRWTSFVVRTGEGLHTDDLLAVMRDRVGRLWVGSNRGLYRMEGGRFRNFERAEGLPHPTVLSLDEDRQGTLWVGTIRGACTRRGDDTFAPVLDSRGVALRYVFGLLGDREGGTWAVTSGGLFRFRVREVETLGTGDGLADSLVTAVAPARGGGLWITTGGGLNRMGPDGSIRPHLAGSSLPTVGLTAVHEGRDGDLWVGTWGSGLFRLRGEAVREFNVVDGLGSPVIRSVLQARDGTVWVATWGGGLARISGDRVTGLTTRDGLGHDRVRVLLEGRRGELWVGTAAGLSRIERGKITTFTARDGLEVDSVFSLHEDDQGVLWIGTSGGGLVRFEKGRFTSFTTADGLYADTISQILEDRAGDLWLGSPRGIFRVQKRQLREHAEGRLDVLTCLAYARNEGMRSGQCSSGSHPAGCLGDDGRVWFPTFDGLAVVDPTRAAANDVPPPTVVEDILVDGLSAPGGRAAGPGRGNLEFRYAACSFGDPSKVRFRYRLEGFDAGWTYAGTRRVAFYTNVPPGRYRFRVRACNDDGLWDEAGASAAIELPPHFYQTGSFFVLLLSGGLLMLAVAFRLRMASCRAREADLVRIVAERTAELEQAKAELESRNERLSELATTDPLTGLRNRRHFVDSLASALLAAATRGRPTSVLVLDVDHFKSYNDAYGHPAGDEALRGVAGILRASGRDTDVVARYGGEEFVVLLPNTGAPEAAGVAERLRGRIEAAEWPHRPVTASFGVATAEEGRPADPSALVSDADLALYRAKRLGRNRIIHADGVEPPAPVDDPAEDGEAGSAPGWCGPERRSGDPSTGDRRRRLPAPRSKVPSAD